MQLTVVLCTLLLCLNLNNHFISITKCSNFLYKVCYNVIEPLTPPCQPHQRLECSHYSINVSFGLYV